MRERGRGRWDRGGGREKERGREEGERGKRGGRKGGRERGRERREGEGGRGREGRVYILNCQQLNREGQLGGGQLSGQSKTIQKHSVNP